MVLVRVEQARLRVGRPARATAGASALRAEGPCAARRQGRLRPSPSHGRHAAAQRAYARSSTCSPSRRACARRDAPCRAALLGAVQAPPDLPTRSLASMTAACPDSNTSVHRQSRGRVCAGSDICGAEERKARGRARSALRLLTRRDCPSAANAVSAASFATGREAEHRRGPGAQRRAAASERRRTPARGFARSADQQRGSS